MLDRLLRGEEVAHEGAHYRVHGRVAQPLQRPRPPLVIAANARRSLGVVEFIAFWPFSTGPRAAEHPRRLAVLERVAADVLPKYR